MKLKQDHGSLCILREYKPALEGTAKEDKGWLWKRREETSLSFLKIFHDVKKNTEFSSQCYFFLEDIYYKENKLFSRNIFSSPQYFHSNVSS